MIKKLPERALIIVLNDKTSNFETLFAESRDICNHHKNIQTIKIEAYKIQNNLALPIMKTRLEKNKHSI